MVVKKKPNHRAVKLYFDLNQIEIQELIFGDAGLSRESVLEQSCNQYNINTGEHISPRKLADVEMNVIHGWDHERYHYDDYCDYSHDFHIEIDAFVPLTPKEIENEKIRKKKQAEAKAKAKIKTEERKAKQVIIDREKTLKYLKQQAAKDPRLKAQLRALIEE